MSDRQGKPARMRVVAAPRNAAEPSVIAGSGHDESGASVSRQDTPPPLDAAFWVRVHPGFGAGRCGGGAMAALKPRLGLLAGAALLAAAAPAMPRMPGFAAQLSASRRIAAAADWQSAPAAEAWRDLAAARPEQRQSVRWRYALGLISERRSAEALGVLGVMLQDDPNLALADDFSLAYGRVLAEVGRSADAAAILNRPGLAGNTEACAWRLRVAADVGSLPLALKQVRCARPALTPRTARERTRFLLPAARSALAAGEPRLALNWLSFAPSIAAVRTTRIRALLALGRVPEATAQQASLVAAAGPADRADAELAEVELLVARRKLPAQKAAARLDSLLYRWRGDVTEERALWLRYRVAKEAGDPAAALASGATLVRYHEPGPRLPALMAELQAVLGDALKPGSRVPLAKAAGLFWEYRDLIPAGSEGDALALVLAGRLQDAGLYGRAAELLEHQLFERARDLAQGPLSVRVATLHILAGKPDRALDALRRTGRIIYPSAMLQGRQRIEAVALQQLGRGREALTVLQDVPGSGALYAELLWKQRSWAAFADLTRPTLPPGQELSDVRQAMILRHAIALGLTGREAELARLRSRYIGAFTKLPTAGAFDLLTSAPGSLNPDSFTQAMAAIPAASPAGELADLLEIAPVPPEVR